MDRKAVAFLILFCWWAVIAAPEESRDFVVVPESASLDVGDNMRLNCNDRKGNPLDQTSTQWWHNGSLVSDRKKLHLYVLFVTSVGLRDAGVYQCGNASLRSSNVSITVFDKVPVRVLSQTEPSRQELEGNSFKLCAVVKHAEHVVWMLNGDDLTKHFPRIESSSHKPKYCLIVQNATRNDSGTYSLQAYGHVGSKAVVQFNVSVRGLPSKPMSLKAKVTNNLQRIRASWGEPALDDGTYPVASYNVCVTFRDSSRCEVFKKITDKHISLHLKQPLTIKQFPIKFYVSSVCLLGNGLPAVVSLNYTVSETEKTTPNIDDEPTEYDSTMATATLEDQISSIDTATESDASALEAVSGVIVFFTVLLTLDFGVFGDYGDADE
eukprot:m.202001 g.202001  ORF g.202001 m.202001 type:complete len:380 (+) comp39601_c1_seq23:910-2049(+)